jgi:hypothetical protein
MGSPLLDFTVRNTTGSGSSFVVFGASKGRRGDHPDHHRIDLTGIAVTVRFLAGETETVAFIELEMALPTRRSKLPCSEPVLAERIETLGPAMASQRGR